MLAPDWKDYRILGTGDGLKLERWGDIVLLRPDPQAIWEATVDYKKFDTHARYERDRSGGGRWIVNKPMPEEWTVRWRDMKFGVRPTGFKHTGLFPEQAVNWSILSDVIEKARKDGRGREPIRILNLFAYTGASTAVLAKRGAVVTHVDAAKGMVERAQANCAMNGVPRENTRFIVDDCKKFVQREIRRGKKYDAVIMDPPSYGRGASGEVWRMEDDVYGLVKLCADVLSDDPTFFLINSYTTGLQPQTIQNLLTLTIKGGRTEAYEVSLPTECEIALPCGCSGLWRKE
ncbi:MAG: class I SAM-dependent methyltransferase [Clostridiales bacterium]|nr:class I SAM-dependent methyltransferase [Clostridiales bacterium]